MGRARDLQHRWAMAVALLEGESTVARFTPRPGLHRPSQPVCIIADKRTATVRPGSEFPSQTLSRRAASTRASTAL
jgi:hypothetical protein